MNLNAPTPVYPAPPTVPNDITPPDQAIYVPAITKGFAHDVWRWEKSGTPRDLPTGVRAADLNFLDPHNQFFRISHFLISAGLARSDSRPSIIKHRDLTHTRGIADSGGYQIASNRLKQFTDADRLKNLRWQEQFDICITLDVPTGPLLKPVQYPYNTFSDCLNATLQHLDFYERNKSASSVWWLNVLQGNDRQQADIWYDQVRAGFKGDGWAFAGPLRHNFYELLRRILIMHQDGEIQEKKWIRVLGTCELETAVLLTALQRAINRHINPNIRISFDTSSPFRNLAWNKAYTLPTFDAKQLSMPTRAAPDGRDFIGSQVKWPWPSPLGNRMVLGDFCVPKTAKSRRYRDTVSNHLLAHHNLAALCWGVAQANRVFDAESIDHNHTIGHAIGFAAEAIEEVISTKSMTSLHDCRFVFAELRHGQLDHDSEAERDFESP